MRPLKFLAIPSLVALAAASAQGQGAPVGHIQVMCPAGVQIYLDGAVEKTATPIPGGLIIQDVPAGAHYIKAVMDGFELDELRVDLAPGQVFRFVIKAPKPALGIEETGDGAEKTLRAQTGTLVVQSLPVECTIDIPSAGLFGASKTKDKWTVKRMPAGSHEITLKALGKTLTYTLPLAADSTVRLMANFIEEDVEADVVSARQVAAPQAPPADPVMDPDTGEWLVDDFEGGKHVWRVQSWGAAGTLSMAPGMGTACLRVDYGSRRPGDKCVVMRRWPAVWAFETRDLLVLDVSKESDLRAQLAVAFFTDKGRGYYESPAVLLRRGANRAVTFDLRAKRFKCAETGWRLTAPLGNPGSVGAMLLLVYSNSPGTILVDNVRLMKR